MEFGTLLLNIEAGLQNQNRMIDRRYRDVMVISVGKFIFQRPDNGKYIIEMNNRLIEERADKLFLLNHANVEYFKNLIKNDYDTHIKHKELQISNEVKKRELEEKKAMEIYSSIDRVKAKNTEEFSENREKSIRQQSKALRRYQNRIENINKKIGDLENVMTDYKKHKQFSLEIAEKDMKNYL